MTWELVPESDPGRGRGAFGAQPTARSPWWAVLIVGVLVALAGAALLIWPFLAASWMLAVLIGSALIANGLALMVGLRAGGASLGGGVLLVLLGLLAIVFSDFTVTMLVTFVGGGLVFVGALWLIIASRIGAARRSALAAQPGAAQLGRGGGVRSLLWLIPPVLLLAGGIAALVWPGVALSIAAVGVGVVTLALGASIVWGAFRLRRAVAV